MACWLSTGAGLAIFGLVVVEIDTILKLHAGRHSTVAQLRKFSPK